jgi:hypothetical protein
MKAAHLDITVEGDLQACLSWSKHWEKAKWYHPSNPASLDQ